MTGHVQSLALYANNPLKAVEGHGPLAPRKRRSMSKRRIEDEGTDHCGHLSHS